MPQSQPQGHDQQGQKVLYQHHAADGLVQIRVTLFDIFMSALLNSYL